MRQPLPRVATQVDPPPGLAAGPPRAAGGAGRLATQDAAADLCQFAGQQRGIRSADAAEADAHGFFAAGKQAFLGDGQAYNWTIQQRVLTPGRSDG